MITGELLLLERIPRVWSQSHQAQSPTDPRLESTLEKAFQCGVWTALLALKKPIRFVAGRVDGKSYCAFLYTSLEEKNAIEGTLRVRLPGLISKPGDACIFSRRWGVPLVVRGWPGVSPDVASRTTDMVLGCNARGAIALYCEAWPMHADAIERGTADLQNRLTQFRLERLSNPHEANFAAAERDVLRMLDRYRSAAASGAAQAFTALLAESDADINALAVTMTSHWNSGAQEQPARWDRFDGAKNWNILLPEEIAQLAGMPTKSHSGIEVSAPPTLRTVPRVISPESSVYLGDILAGDHSTGDKLAISKETLFQHVGVFGRTGSGKTNALRFLLAQAWRVHGIPFLVIEPGIKREFRNLVVEPWAQPMRLYPVGDPRCSLRLNLLEPQGVPLATHLGYVRAVLEAAFAWVPPQQYILERALVRVYEERGFNLTTGRNHRGEGRSQWPSLANLIEVIPNVIRESGYDKEISGNLEAGLRTRLRSLLVGPLGVVLNCRCSTPIEELLATPGVVELALLGAAEQKCLVLAALMVAISEFRLSKGSARAGHLLVIEEAHRLLRANQHGSTGAETADHAVETFVALMAELRAFREGVVLLEQGPTLLHPSALANASLKICLQPSDAANLELCAANLHLDARQKAEFPYLEAGEAIALGTKMDGAYKIRVPLFEGRETGSNSIEQHIDRLKLPTGPGHLSSQVDIAVKELMLAVASQDAPEAIVVRSCQSFHQVNSKSLQGAKALVEEILRRKGFEGQLSFNQEDQLYASWCSLLDGLASRRVQGTDLVALVSLLHKQTEKWGMPPARRRVSRCHPGCRAWFEARLLAIAHRSQGSVPMLANLTRSEVCLRDAGELLNEQTVKSE